MSLSTVHIAYLGERFKLVKERLLERTVYSLRRLVDNRWITINYWDDIGHVASLLVIFGYEADMQSALDMLNILAAA
ncbi:MAG: hypothetical protein ACI85E_000988 [Marinomonas primoryensis]|jgi:hypothetical protein